MGKRFLGSGSAAAADVMQCSGSASIVIGDSAIAVVSAVPPRVSSSAAMLTAGISGVRKAGWIIATGNARIGGAGRNRRPDRA